MNDKFNQMKDNFTEELQQLQIRFFKVLDELRQAESKQAEPQGKWKPKMGERYWFADVTNQIFRDFDYWDDKEYHFHLYNAGLIRQTENEAIELGKQMYYTQWFNDLSDVTDEMWEDEKMPKYNKLNDTFAGAAITNSVFQYKYPNVAYFSSKEKLEAAIETIGKENFEKYVMRIKGD